MPFIRQIIKEEGLAIAEEKVRLTGRGNRQEVTGLVVNEAVSVPRATRRRLRAALHHLTVGRPLTWNHAEIHLTHLRGHIAFVKSVQPAVGAVFSRQLSRFLPKRKKQKRKSSRSATNAQPPGTTSRQRTSIAAEERTMQTLLATQVADELAALADRPTVLTDLALAIVNGVAAEAKTRYEEACEASITRSCITDAIHAAMARVIRLFNQNEFYVPELLIAARAAFAVAEKARRSASVGTAGRAIIGCVAGDFHDIGKTLVAEMWRLGGFEVIDLGTVNSPKQFLDATRKYNPIVVGLSAGMTTTMPHIKTITEALRSANPSAKIVVGGLPVTKTFAKSIGADGYAPDCVSALELVKQLVRATTAQ
jgi:5-methyltetrahydrofolate--homocysteine methyltransferase